MKKKTRVQRAIIIGSCLALFVFLAFLGFYYAVLKGQIASGYRRHIQETYIGGYEKAAKGYELKGHVLSQEFLSRKEIISGVRFYRGHAALLEGRLKVRLYQQDGELLREEQVSVKEGESQETEFFFSEAVPVKKGERYRIEFSMEGEGELYVSSGDVYGDGEACYNGETLAGDVAMSVLQAKPFHKLGYWLLCIFCMSVTFGIGMRAAMGEKLSKKEKTVIKWGVGSLVFVAFSISIFLSAIGPLYTTGYRFIHSDEQSQYAMAPLGVGGEVRQDFVVDRGILAIEFAVGTYGERYEEGYLQVGICEKGSEAYVYWRQVPLSEFSDCQLYRIVLDRPVLTDREIEYELVIRGTGLTEETPVALIGADRGENQGECRLNGGVVLGGMRMNVYIQSKLSLLLTIVFWGLSFLMFASLCRLWHRKGKALKEHRIYLFLAVVLGIGYLLVFPPGTVPDEFAHYYTASYYSDRLMGVEKVNGGIFRDEEGSLAAYITKRQGDREFQYVARIPSMEAYGWQYSGNLLFCSDTSVVWREEPVPVTNAFPGLYMGTAVGITMARLLGLSDVALFYMGRLFNYGLAVLLVYFAIRLLPRWKKIFFVVALLPMTEHLFASCSYDGIVIALAMFFIALCMNLACSGETITWKKTALLVAAGALLAPGKVVYLPLCFFCLAIPSSNFKDRKAAWMVKSGVLAASFLMFCIFCMGSVARYTNPEGIVSTKYSIMNAFTDFPGFLQLILNTLWNNLDFYFTTMIGGKLGYVNQEVPFVIVMLFVLLLVWAVCGEERQKESGRYTRFSVAGFSIVAVVTLLIVATGYTWTDIGETVLAGLQGRYWLPVLPLFLISFRVETGFGAALDSRTAAGGILVLHTMILFLSMATILGR
ncbi:MAG: DUF2142 domain-containing protein [Lachnospiraceae bacterium]|nr:DUF2142 domain-containing protein [Lachnospiraceae bacterium]